MVMELCISNAWIDLRGIGLVVGLLVVVRHSSSSTLPFIFAIARLKRGKQVARAQADQEARCEVLITAFTRPPREYGNVESEHQYSSQPDESTGRGSYQAVLYRGV